MTRVSGPSLDQLDRLGDDYAGLIAQALAEVVSTAHNTSTSGDLAWVRQFWAAWIDETLLPALGVAFEVGAAQIRVGLREAVGLTASGGSVGAGLAGDLPERQDGQDGGRVVSPGDARNRLPPPGLTAAFTDVAPTSDALSEQYLASARNRLVGVGDELWAHAREELLEGLQAGESVPELAARVRRVAPDLTEPRAVQIARTEVLGAVNAGALEQVLASGATGSKSWVATDDQRTRHTHDLADNDTVALSGYFTVGGFPMQRPHDPAGPPQETISCRCTLSFSLDIPEPEPVTVGEVVEISPEEFDRATRAPRQAQKRDRSFLARVFADGLAALVGWFKARTAAAMMPEQTFEGADMTDATGPLQQYVRDDGSWQRILTVEGKPTGDRRQFDLGALRFAETPLPLSYQPPSHGGVSTDGKIAGRIDEVFKVGEQVWGRGVHDLGGPDGLEAHRLVRDGFLPGVSVDVDDVDMEVVFADGDELGLEPELMLVHAGRIRGAALVTIPAFVEATLDYPTPTPMVAAAPVVDLDGYRPPVEFFSRCTDPIPVVSTPDGRVFQPKLGVSDDLRVWGYAAEWEECHIGYPGVCTSPPREDDFAHYLVGEVVCAGGERVPVGQITLGTGHAALTYGARAAAEHYDHTGAVAADVVVGADDHGIWLSGAVRPGADLAALRAAGFVSGDWRRIGGSLRLVALLAVNVGGFQQTRARVASGVQTSLVAAGLHEREITTPDLSKVKLRIARPILAGRKAAAVAKVRG